MQQSLPRQNPHNALTACFAVFIGEDETLLIIVSLKIPHSIFVFSNFCGTNGNERLIDKASNVHRSDALPGKRQLNFFTFT